MTAAGFVLARFIHFASLAALFGIAWSPAYADALPIGVSLRRGRLWAAVLAIVSGVAWFELTVVRMADSPSAAADPATLWMTVCATDFREGSSPIGLVLSGLLLASLALTGHAQAEMGAARWLHASADALHLLAAGLWLGGLGVLGLLLATKTQAHQHEAESTTRLLENWDCRRRCACRNRRGEQRLLGPNADRLW
jgi:putative copper resistance protein D